MKDRIKQILIEHIDTISYDEQQKIADTISSIDELISLQTHKLELLKKHKKGLEQKLLPNIKSNSDIKKR